MYVDGQPVSVVYPFTEASPPFLPVLDSSSRSLFIGESESGDRAFSGRMAEFRFWDRVVDPTVIQLQHDRRLDGNETGLQFYLPLDQTLEPFAVSTGAYAGIAEISGARRIPRVLPWEALESHFTLTYDGGNGWWQERTLGWLFGDAYPWVYFPAIGWVFSGHGTGKDRYLLFRGTTNWGWLQTTPALYPWFYRHANGSWMWYMEGTTNPAWFYDSASASWLTGTDDLPPF